MISRRKTSIKNTIVALFSEVMVTSVGFLLPQAIVINYGSAANGLLNSLQQFIQYFTFLEAGLSGAAIFSLYKPLAENDKKTIVIILSSAKKLYGKIGTIFVILTAISSVVYPYAIADTGYSNFAVSVLFCMIGLNGATQFLFIGKYKVLLNASQNSRYVAITNSVSTCLYSVIIIIASYCKIHILISVGLGVTAYFLRAIAYCLIVRKLFPQYDFHKCDQEYRFKNQKEVFIQQILSLIIMNSSTMILSFTKTDMAEISVFTMYNMVLTAVFLVTNAMNTGVSASFGDLIAHRDKVKLQNIYCEYEILHQIFWTIVFACVLVLYTPFMRLYTGKFKDISYVRSELCILFTILGAAWVIRIQQSVMIIAAGRFKEIQRGSIIEAFLAVVLSLVGLYFWGLAGLLLGRIISAVYRMIDFIIYNGKEIVPYLEDFQWIAVREQTAYNIVCNALGNKCKERISCVVDPTFLIDKAEWEKQKNTELTLPKNGYILTYYMIETPLLREITKILHKKTGLPIVNIKPSKKQALFHEGINMMWAGPREFLTCYSGAKYVVTNSFHGTAFAINFEVPFYVAPLPDSMAGEVNSRLIDVLELFGLSSRYIQSSADLEDIVWDYDREAVRCRKQDLVEQSKKYLNKMLTTHVELNLKDKGENILSVGKSCTGCGACAYVCPVNCITMKLDLCGFNKPVIDTDACIKCEKCKSICPALNDIESVIPLEVYAVVSKDLAATQRSSSGGAFYHIARYVLDELHGYICGAVLDDNLRLKHIVSDSHEDLIHMQGSKYIQSDITDCYERISDILFHNKYVLFTGTPCQVAGIKQHFGKSDYLITMDLICHGTPSNDIFVRYMKKFYGDFCFKNFSFRQKNIHTRSSYSYVFTNSDRKNCQVKVFSFEDPYYQSFIRGDNYRESCYICKYAQKYRIGDITVGDCANFKSYKLPLDKVFSTVCINTDKGSKLWSNIAAEFDWVKADYESEVKYNTQLHSPAHRTRLRNHFYDDILSLPFKDLKDKYCPKRTWKDKIKNYIVWHTTPGERKLFKRSVNR